MPEDSIEADPAPARPVASRPPGSADRGSTAASPTRGREEEVRIESLAFGGDAVARLGDGRVAFVRGALPGERVRVRLTRVKKSHAEAEAVEILEAAPERVTPRCRHFGTCGGCRHQDLRYSAQLAWKTRQVQETLERLGGLRGVEVRPARGMDDPWFYRNKMEFGIAGSDGAPVIGLRERGRFDRVFDLEECPIFSPLAGAIVAAVEGHARVAGYRAYDPRRQTGFLRHLVVRECKNTPDRLVALVTSPGRLEERAFVEAVQAAAPVTSIWHAVTASRSNVVDFGEVRLLHGTERIAELVPPLRLELGPGAFLQTNTRMAEELYRSVREEAAFRGGETLVDLYCGIGSFALYLARDVERVIGLEMAEGAVADARHNARLNGIANAEFHVADDRRGFPAFLSGLVPRTVDAVLIDPPRGGVHERTLQAVQRLAPPRVFYVSCNPASLARDLAILVRSPGTYSIRTIQPFDLFPHTPHIETFVALELVEGASA